jgi:hypothetical protein
MATALEIHRELDQPRAAPMEQEMRRRLFWTCYLLDRFMACGSKRPSLIADQTIMLRLPSWIPSPSAGFVEGGFFQTGSNLQHFQGGDKKSQGSTGMLIDVTRILGRTNSYLAAGGVRGDSHFPWHSLSNLSKIRQDLDTWASGTDNVFSSVKSLFGQADSTILVLSKLVYHLIHCLIYRPFLPIDLAELAGNGQHESWQIEATNMCFLHANAIAELIELGKQASTIEWPAFVGYCICTAGTVHIHGAHYSKQGAVGEMNVFSSSAHFLSREMQHLSELRYAWASVQHHRETLQGIYNAHAELVKTILGNTMRQPPSLHLEDFFERYAHIGGPNGPTFQFDAANLSLSDAVVEFTTDAYSGPDLYAPRLSDEMERPGLKRKNTASSARMRTDIKNVATAGGVPSAALSGLGYPHRSAPNGGNGSVAQPSPALLTTQHRHAQGDENRMNEAAANNAAVAAAAAAGFGLNPHSQSTRGMPHLAEAPYSPGYHHFTSAPGPGSNQNQNSMGDSGDFDPMFGTLPTNAFSSPAAWHGDDGLSRINAPGAGPPGVAGKVAPSPGTGSNNGSSTTHGEEKDPFLSLLEQLAENEQRINSGGSGELDFFLTGGATS